MHNLFQFSSLKCFVAVTPPSWTQPTHSSCPPQASDAQEHMDSHNPLPDAHLQWSMHSFLQNEHCKLNVQKENNKTKHADKVTKSYFNILSLTNSQCGTAVLPLTWPNIMAPLWTDYTHSHHSKYAAKDTAKSISQMWKVKKEFCWCTVKERQSGCH